ncbi:TPA: ead/Ea22-like family protein [Klebsiella variicola]|uniref:ead/Ea22-like family protein n=2 Tax=Klebsiella quasipneumoniae TaxID=1463165 RepID=UPI0010361488|nr:ead/Ea22-like family protein [Klebsiella quasipneumoniae]TBP46522.1 ead/Ea22-like family protein [Klebsiella quasipneumoniae subsp. quasipneumoniae]TBP77723.1 ead/Ea22-like family protein [Klebsiella quasipneumoniae subsp. quasipneumoniae]TBQ08626.1 ead/Ea22-like family protein [Klebsiella quasipneumoniae subsp. quasipneumoniae]TBQ71279.1 ead/Ea22-like family protein [Klebsiella quasipneumoniae subsp. quasipneumoniae]
MTDINELAQSLKAAAEKATQGDWRAFQYHDGRCGIGGGHNAEIMVCEHISKERPHDAMFIALANPANVLALVEALEKAQQAPSMPLGLHPDTQKLVADFCTAIADKLYKAQLKYGYDTDWKQDGWPSQCQAHFHQHIAKGDPRDVAAYCAFMWWHGWSTKPPEGLESRTVTVKLPDYRNTYKSPLADEVEHQVRLALELFSSAAGIKVEAE